MGPEAGAVLADAPAFFFAAALAVDGLQRLLWLACFPVSLGVELSEMRSDDFRGRIAFDPLRAQVPAGHAAFLVEQVNGVIGDALHQKPELLFTAPQRLLGGFAL